MRRQVLLEVEIRHLDVSGGFEKSAKLIVQDELATVLRMLETVVRDVLINELGHLGARDELTFRKSDEFAQLRADFLLTVEAVVFSPLLSLLTIRILLGVLDLTNKLGQGLDILGERDKFSLNGFEGHYIYLMNVIFK
jgi:hypothetical protein